MGPGNQVRQFSPTSPALNNLNGQGTVNNFANGQMNNSPAMMQRNNPNPAMQGVQLPPMMNQTPNNQANFGQANQQMVLPTEFGQQGLAPNNYPPANQMQVPSNQVQMTPGYQQQAQPNYQPQGPNFPQQGQNYQQQSPNFQPQVPPNQLQLPPNNQQQQPPPLINIQGPSLPMNNQSNLDLQIPDSLPRNAPEAARASDPALLPATYNQSNLTLDPVSNVQKDQPVRIIAGYTSPKKPGEPATVMTTAVEHQPVLEAPITPLRQ
jgi:hypothetical protein